VAGAAVLELHADHGALVRLVGRLHPSAAKVANLMAPSAAVGNGPYYDLYLLNAVNALAVWGLPAVFGALSGLRGQLEEHVRLTTAPAAQALAPPASGAALDGTAESPLLPLVPPVPPAATADPPGFAAALASARTALARVAELQDAALHADADADAHADVANAHAGVFTNTGDEAVQELQTARRARMGRLKDQLAGLECAARALRGAGLLRGFSFDPWKGLQEEEVEGGA